jgi:hypothetical protein
MHGHALETYPPINTLKSIARDLWIVDGPLIQFGLPWRRFAPRVPLGAEGLSSGARRGAGVRGTLSDDSRWPRG